jgi:hypothetical protein
MWKQHNQGVNVHKISFRPSIHPISNTTHSHITTMLSSRQRWLSLVIATTASRWIESRLKGVNRRNLKFTTLNTHYKPGLALELKSSPGESRKQIKWESSEWTRDLFYRGLVPKNLVPVEEVTVGDRYPLGPPKK